MKRTLKESVKVRLLKWGLMMSSWCVMGADATTHLKVNGIDAQSVGMWIFVKHVIRTSSTLSIEMHCIMKCESFASYFKWLFVAVVFFVLSSIPDAAQGYV